MNRRGNVWDALFIIVGIFMAAITMIIVGVVIDRTADEFNNDASVPQEAKDIISHVDSRFLPMMDFWVVLFLVGMPLISAILAYFNNIHPLFFWLSLVSVILIVMWGAALSVFWDELAEDSLLKTSIDEMPMANFIFSNYAMYALFVFIVVAVGTFIKIRSSEGFVG